MGKWALINDIFIEEEKACLHISDLAFQRGYGIFDFFRLHENKPVFLEDHLDRFYFSARELNLPVPMDRTELVKKISELIGKNELPYAGIRISLTGGYVTGEMKPINPNLVLSQRPFQEPTPLQYANGISLLSWSFQRQLPQIKTIDYLMAIYLQTELENHGAEEVLYHQHGYVTECPRSNIFMVTEGNSLVTPADNILSGITRNKIIGLAKGLFKIEERKIHLEELKKAKEVFITSTTKKILPVSKIDGQTIGFNNVRETTTFLDNKLQTLYT